MLAEIPKSNLRGIFLYTAWGDILCHFAGRLQNLYEV